MIALERIDTSSRIVHLVESGGRGVLAGDGGAIRERLENIGLIASFDDLEAEGNVATKTAFRHRWWIEAGKLCYEAWFQHRWESVAEIGVYLGAALATCTWSPESALRALRLAAYELAVNSLEHGVPVSENPHVGLQLQLGARKIQAIFIDQCKPFDPKGVDPGDLSERARDRANRGYGVAMIQALVDGIEHASLPDGNRILFHKEIER